MRSKYSLDFDPGEDDRLPMWIVVRDDYTVRQVTVGTVVFSSPNKEEAECMLEEYQYFERAEYDYNVFNNQESEFDYV